LRSLLKEVAVSVEAALLAVRILSEDGVEPQTDEAVQTLLAFLENAAQDLEVARSKQGNACHGHPAAARGPALEAIATLPVENGLGFKIKLAGRGCCRMQISFADWDRQQPALAAADLSSR
jgi:hypothetical protein